MGGGAIDIRITMTMTAGAIGNIAAKAIGNRAMKAVHAAIVGPAALPG